jgi:hypothetical protein
MDKKICDLKLNELETVVGGIAEMQVATAATTYRSIDVSTGATTSQLPAVDFRKR